MALDPTAARIAVIIPARDAARSLPACIDALLREGVPGPNIKLIVVDDASTDETPKIAAAKGAVVLQGAGVGPAAARNLGARHATGDVLIFLDADTAPQPGWLAALIAPFADPAIVAVKGRYVTEQRGIVPRFSQLEFEEKYARLERAARIDFVDTGTAAYRSDVFLATGGFDESFPAQSAEDVELAFRLAEQGARFAFSPLARVRHTHAESLFDYLHKKARYGFFRVTVYRRHPTKLRGDSYTPPWMGMQIILAALLPVTLLAAALRFPKWPSAVLAVAYVAGSMPLLRRAWVADRGLFPWVVPLSFARAFAQGLGLAHGLAVVVVQRHRATSEQPRVER